MIRKFLVNAQNDEKFELQQLLIVGKNPQGQFCVNSPDICERHAKIVACETGARLIDLKALPGVRVNRTLVPEANLKNRDLLQFGDQEYFYFEDQDCDFSMQSKNDELQKTFQMSARMAKTEHPLLILGPSGSGKEILALKIHQASNRNLGPFVGVNCSALTETLIESELFGHVKGSFTGAVSDRKGAFEFARGGTLFLDEIGDLPLSLQAKLLRALENHEVRAVGTDRVIKTDVRILAATHMDLAQKIKSEQFRLDLYFRLSVMKVHLPALRDRREDFDDIFYQFAREHRVRFSFAALQALKKYSWPGNIRELKNTVARASVIFQKEQVTEKDLLHILDPLDSAEMKIIQGSMPLIQSEEKKLILNSLRCHLGNQRRAAHELGMPKSTLHDRIKKYQINLAEI